MLVNTYPKLKFQLNIDLDKEMAFQFMDMTGGGIGFGDGIIKLYPELARAKSVTGDERRAVIADFTNKYYSGHQAELDKKLREVSEDWESVANVYFSGVDQIFNKATWPKGEYVCYLSIFNCNPRFLEAKSFQVYQGLSDRTNYIIAHELLHFMFFDYLEAKEPSLKNSQDEHTVWLLSEWFNDVILNLPVFKQFGENVDSAYPEVVEFSSRFTDKAKIVDVKSFFEIIKPVILK